MATIASLNVNMTANSAQLRRELDTVTARSRRFARTQQGIFTRLSRSINTLRFGFGAIASLLAGGAFVRGADTFTNINNLLRSSGVEASMLAEAFSEVQRLTLETRGDLESVARLYSTLNRNAEALMLTQDQIATITRTITQSFALSGATVAETTGATRQLIQALQSGTLRGEELNSVLENAPEIARLISGALGVGVGQLRGLAEQGLLTSNILTTALLGGADEINARFQDTNTTFGQLGSIFQAQILPVLGQLGGVLLPPIAAVLQAISSAIQFLSDTTSAFAPIARFLFLGILAGTALRGLTALAGVITRANAALIGYSRSAVAATLQNIRKSTSLAILAGRLSAVTLGTVSVTRAFRLLATGSLLAANALRFLTNAFRLLLLRFGPIFLAFEAIASIIEVGFINTLRRAGNLFIRFINLIIRGLNALGANLDPLEEFQIVLEETEDSAANLMTSLGELPEINLGDLNGEVSAFARTLGEARDEASRLNELGAQAFDRLADSLTDFVTTGRLQIRDFARFVITEFIRIQIRSALARSFAGSSLFGGFRQQGGPVGAGQAYIVGESGPELFVPNTNGNIVSNDRLNQATGGNATNVTYNINAVDARSFRDLVARDPEYIYNVAERGRRRRGF